MKFLTGFKPTGELHLGNYIGAIRPALNLEGPGLFCVADYHAMTTMQNAQLLRDNTLKMCAALVALGCSTVYRQSKIPEVQELSWILSCLAPMGLMERGHAVKAAKDSNAYINLGTFNYPVLMAADILLFQTEGVPVGKDQHQHIQVAQLLANKLNLYANKDVVKIPMALIEDVGVIPGTNGQKMSKSNNNTIALFSDLKRMKKDVYSIKTSSTPREEVMSTDSCTVFKLYQHLSTAEQIKQMIENYKSNNYGYGDAKEDLLQRIIKLEESYIDKYRSLIADSENLFQILSENEHQLRVIATQTLNEVKAVVGL